MSETDSSENPPNVEPPLLPRKKPGISKALAVRLAVYAVLLLGGSSAVWVERSAWSECNDSAEYFIRRLEQLKPIYETEVHQKLGRKPDVHDEESVIAGLYQEYRWQGLLSTYYLKLTYTWDMTGYELNGVEGAVRRRWQSDEEEREPTELDIELSEKAMEEAVRIALRKGTGEISRAEMETIEKLDIEGTQLVDLKPLAQMPNLQVLYMGDNRMRDVGGLKPLGKLRILKMRHNSVDDFSALSAMSRLEDLDAGHNRLTNLGPLSRLSALRKLDLGNNQVSSLTALGRMPWLEHLDLANNKITNLAPLSGARNLQELRLGENQIDNLEPLAGLKALEVLSLERNEITDISALAGLGRLKRLYLSRNHIRDVSALSGLKNLYELELHGNPISQAEVDALRQALPNCRVEFSAN